MQMLTISIGIRAIWRRSPEKFLVPISVNSPSSFFAWLSDRTHVGPSAQVVWPIVGQEILNGDIWRASGITSELQLYCTIIGALVFAALMLFAGWFHYHKAAPKLAWFQDVESMLNHHLAGLLGLGSLSWAGHQVHVSLPINQFLNAGFCRRSNPIFHFELVKICRISDFSWRIRSSNRRSVVDRYCSSSFSYCNSFPDSGLGHKGLYEILTTLWHAQLSLNLAVLGSLTIVVAHHIYSMPPYPYLATDYGTQLSLFTHHMWIGGFLIVGAAVHATIFTVKDYDPTTRYNDILDRVLRHRDTIISHLNWASPSATAPGATTSTRTVDFLVHHIHAFTIHVTVLILLKGVLFVRSSRLIQDKANLGFRFPCDGPRRGGTCQVSVWDHVFLGLFWMYNAISISDVWGSISDQGVVTHITGGNFT
ncbi:hypothetical protein RDABS01_013867 [Bienertia sinuspersici]